MRLLHTSDWHVGKEIRGRSRADEHRAVLSEIATIAGDHDVELVIVAGDLFETAAPSAESEEIVYQALLSLASGKRRVAVIAGNHDNARRLHAVAPLLELGNVHLVTRPTRPSEGGVLQFRSRDGHGVKLAMLPFVSQRGIIRAADLMSLAGFEAAQRYTDRIARLIDSLCEDFSDDCVNLIAAHGFVLGGETGGGERAAHLIEEYAISTHAFPPTAAYVALGHLHRPQSLAGATSLRYCGSPLQLDFGETAQDKQVNLVEVLPGVPARVDPLPVTSGRALHTIAGDLDQLAEQALDLPSDCWVRAIARTERRAGLAEEVRELIGDRVVDVILAGVESDSSPSDRSSRRGRPPRDLFIEFLAERGVEDERLLALFDQLLDRASSPTGTGAS